MKNIFIIQFIVTATTILFSCSQSPQEIAKKEKVKQDSIQAEVDKKAQLKFEQMKKQEDSLKAIPAKTDLLKEKPITAQTDFYGQEYISETNNYIKIKYNRIYSGSGNTFITTYNIYHPSKGYHAWTIIATHHKAEKKVIVEVDEVVGTLLSEMYRDTISYETYSMGVRGHRGLAEESGYTIPPNLAVQFATNKYENVNVLSTLGKTLEYSGEYPTYFFFWKEQIQKN